MIKLTERYYFLPKIFKRVMNEEYHVLFMNCVHALFKFCCNNLSWINKMCNFLTKMHINRSTKKQLFKETSTFCITTYDKNTCTVCAKNHV